MKKKTYKEKTDDYLKAEYGRTFSISETNSSCEDFARLPISDQCAIINRVWHIDFDDEIEQQATTIPKKIAVLIWKLSGKTNYLAIEDFVSVIFLFFKVVALTMIICLIAIGMMHVKVSIV